MKFQHDPASAHHITATGNGWVAAGGVRHTHSMLIGAQGLLQAWRPTSFADLRRSDMEVLAALDCELILFGSGHQHRFLPPDWLHTLIQRRIGLEAMTTAAACRTYNVLASEGRRVVAALLVEPAQPSRPLRAP